MSTLSEALDQPESTPIHDALSSGLDVLGQNQQVSFQPYVRTVLPVDGFVFWLNAGLLSPSQLAAAGLASADPIVVDGSLHYASLGHQNADETIVMRRVDFSAEQQITAFAEIAPRALYIGDWQVGEFSFKFTFSTRSAYYSAANIHHYVGDAVYPVFERQLIETLADFDERQVVSNSLPIWLRLMTSPSFPTSLAPGFELFPAFLVPDNLVPPYAVIDIPENSTSAMQMAPHIGRNGTHHQLCEERAIITLYGLRNDDVLAFQDYVAEYALNTQEFGFSGPLNPPRDKHRIQIELGAMAMGKQLEFEINYNQLSVRNLARQLIAQVGEPAFYPSDKPIIPSPQPIVVSQS